MKWIILVAFVVIQIELFWLIYKYNEIDKTNQSLGKWILELSKKVEDVVYNEEKETKEFMELINSMRESDNPYQE